MNLQNIIKILGIVLIALAVGGGLGYYYAPDKIKIKEKIVEKIVTEKDEKITKKYDPNSGKLVEEIKETKEKETNTSKNSKSTEKEKTKKHYAVKAGAAIDPRNDAKLTPRVGAEMRLPFFNSWVGAEVDININRPLIGGYLRVEF